MDLFLYLTSVSGNNYASQSGSRIIKPGGNNTINLSEGTLSLWLLLRTIGSENNMSSQSACRLFDSDKSTLQVYFTSNDGSDIICKLYINKMEIASKKVAYNNGWFHVYIVWGKKLQNNKTIKIFIDKKEEIAHNASLPDLSSLNFIASLDGYVLAHGSRKCKKKYGIFTNCHNITGGTNSSASMGKLKLWNSIVSEDPEAEYNN
jgi:hypothetical protein